MLLLLQYCIDARINVDWKHDEPGQIDVCYLQGLACVWKPWVHPSQVVTVNVGPDL